ncbi:hypothetical protein TorRG33x02_319800 [Trema orientale]|uniref:Uncharacterized protein n=1 Tax=Trema orientale TaxID=63057 RepID=A0A2P5BIH7_TREOI|nr:hypothetical protein TorRG33x02_319800 [Trema orientale]
MEVPLCQSSCSLRPSIPRQSLLCRSTKPPTSVAAATEGGTLKAMRPWFNQKGVVDRHGVKLKMAVECANLGPVQAAEVESRELDYEMSVEEAAEWMKAGSLREKCGGGRGVVELLECLEREAIMGEDHGREPHDYNRRAQIFHRSARVFQALKESTSTSTPAAVDE